MAASSGRMLRATLRKFFDFSVLTQRAGPVRTEYTCMMATTNWLHLSAAPSCSGPALLRRRRSVYGRDLVEALERWLHLSSYQRRNAWSNIKCTLAQDHSKPVTSCSYPVGCCCLSVKKLGVSRNTDPKPVPGDGNGAGMHGQLFNH